MRPFSVRGGPCWADLMMKKEMIIENPLKDPYYRGMKDMSDTIEERLRGVEQTLVKQEQQISEILKTTAEIKLDIKEHRTIIRNNLSRLFWILGGGFISGIITWIIKGGLSNVVV